MLCCNACFDAIWNFNDDESDTKLSINSEANSWLWPTASVDQKAEDSSILSAIILEKGWKKKNGREKYVLKIFLLSTEEETLHVVW